MGKSINSRIDCCDRGIESVLSLTLSEFELVQSMSNSVVESTVARELMAEELFKSSGSSFEINDDDVFEFRVFLLTVLMPGATASDLSRRLGINKKHTIERHLAKLREIGVLGAWTRSRRGQWRKPGSRYPKGGPAPMQHWLVGDPRNPTFQNMDVETEKSLWRARKFLVKTPEFRMYLARSMKATMKMINVSSTSLDGLLKKIPELKLLLPSGTGSNSHPKLWLEDEAAAYAASRLLFADPEGAKEAFPPGESRRLSFMT